MKTNMPNLRFPEFRDQGHWTMGNLKSICHMKAGKFISAIEIYEKYDDGLYPCYGGNGLRGYTKRYNQNGTFPLIGRQGALCGNVTFGNKKFYATEHAIVVKSNDGIDVNWLYHALCWLNLNQYATGQAQPGLSVEAIEKIAVAVPPNQYEQQKIADCLVSLDELISTESRKLDALASYKKGLMQQLFPAEGETVPKLRFPEFRNAPEWKEKKLAEISHSYQGYGFPEKYQGKKSGEYPFYKVSDISQAVINGSLSITESANYISSEVLSILQAKLVPPNAVIFAKIGEGVRLNRRAITTCKCVIDNNTMGLKAINGKCDDYFLYCILTQIDLIEYAGGVVPSINKSTIENIAIFCPSISEQKKIANCLASLDELIAVQTEKLGGLKNFKKGMMQQLFPAVDKVSV